MLWFGPAAARTVLVFAAGDDGRADDPVVSALAEALAERGIATLSLGAPAPGEGSDAQVVAQLCDALGTVGPREQVVLGGFSRGAKAAVALAAERGARGLLLASYPFHPRRDPSPGDRLTALQQLSVPALIVQGTRDALGNREQVRGYALPSTVQVAWLEDGNHALVPRVRSGRSQQDLLWVASQAAVAFVQGL